MLCVLLQQSHRASSIAAKLTADDSRQDEIKLPWPLGIHYEDS